MLPGSFLASSVQDGLLGGVAVDPGHLDTVGHLNVLGHLDGHLVALGVLHFVAVLLVGVGILGALLLLHIVALLVVLGLIGLLGVLGADLK